MSDKTLADIGSYLATKDTSTSLNISDNSTLDEEDLENARILGIIEHNRILGHSDMSDQTLREVEAYVGTKDTSTSPAVSDIERKEFKK